MIKNSNEAKLYRLSIRNDDYSINDCYIVKIEGKPRLEDIFQLMNIEKCTYFILEDYETGEEIFFDDYEICPCCGGYIVPENDEPSICYYAEEPIKVSALINILQKYEDHEVNVCGSAGLMIETNNESNYISIEMIDYLSYFEPSDFEGGLDSVRKWLAESEIYSHIKSEDLITRLMPYKDWELNILGEENNLSVYADSKEVDLYYSECNNDFEDTHTNIEYVPIARKDVA